MKPSAKCYMHFSETDTACVEKKRSKLYFKQLQKMILDTFRIAVEYISCT